MLLEELMTLFFGESVLLACGIMYLLWWRVAFKPSGHTDTGKATFLLTLTAVLGVSALTLLVMGLAESAVSAHLPLGLLITAAVYGLLAYGTVSRYDRPLTSELLITTLFTGVQVMITLALGKMAHLSVAVATMMTLALLAVYAGMLVCYLRYFELEEEAAYKAGRLPLIMAVCVCAVMLVLMVI